MTGMDAAGRAVKSGDVARALGLLEEEVRAQPQDARLRVFLFGLLAVLGQLPRALTQLTVAAELDATNEPLAQMYGAAIRAEETRRAVFAGQSVPMVLGEPEPWLARLVESRLVDARGDAGAGEALRRQAFEEAPAVGGTLDDEPFVWLADADSRLGPVLEAIVHGKYFWVPFSRLTAVTIAPPQDLRDSVWMPVRLHLEHEGEIPALVPTRYIGSETSGDGAVLLGRTTTWTEVAPGCFHGLGQRLFATDVEDKALMDVRTIALHGGRRAARVAPGAGAHG